MVSVLFVWLYIAATTFLTGFGLCALVRRIVGYRVRDVGCIVAMGLMAVTVYAQVFSLFYKVGAAANLLLAAACLAVAAAERRQIAALLSQAWADKSTAWKIVMAGSVVIWCFCTSRGYMHYDSDLYHAQSIRWIEEYGVVKGLGNIHVRFAYNSSVFALSALYSMKFLTGHSLHAVNGFMALMLWVKVLPLLMRRPVQRKYAAGAVHGSRTSRGENQSPARSESRPVQTDRKTVVTDFARLGAFYYLTVIYSDVVSPASDYAIMCVVFFIVIKWLELLERREESAAPYALLCVAGVYGVTLKLTAGLILLLLAKPLSMLVRERRWRDIGLYLAMGAMTIAPWFARTVLISGYLLYPFPSLDLFAVDWKMDAAAAALDAAEIRTWGRGLNNAALVGLPISEWFPGWFRGSLPAIGKLLVLADLFCLLLSAILLVRQIRRGAEAERVRNGQMLVLATVTASYVFWQISAPLLRYGYAYVLLVVMITMGILVDILCDIFIKCFHNRQKRDMIRRMAVLGMVLLWAFSAVKLVSLVRYCGSAAAKPMYVWQQEYGQYALESYEVDGVRFYYPVSGDRTGYDHFPSIPRQIPIAFRGESVEEGFRRYQDSLEQEELR